MESTRSVASRRGIDYAGEQFHVAHHVAAFDGDNVQIIRRVNQGDSVAAGRLHGRQFGGHADRFCGAA